jgi:hypothetical protein
MRDREHELGRSHRVAGPQHIREGDPGRPDVEAQIEALAAQVRRLGDRLAGRSAPAAAAPAPPTESGTLGSLLADGVLRAAQATGEEIVASARREAERLRSGDRSRTAMDPGALAPMGTRARGAVAALMQETERIEQSLEILRTTIGALAAELAALEERLRALGGR